MCIGPCELSNSNVIVTCPHMITFIPFGLTHRPSDLSKLKGSWYYLVGKFISTPDSAVNDCIKNSSALLSYNYTFEY